jgi:hypothetical protein
MCTTLNRIRIRIGKASKWKVGSGSALKRCRSTTTHLLPSIVPVVLYRMYDTVHTNRNQSSFMYGWWYPSNLIFRRSWFTNKINFKPSLSESDKSSGFVSFYSEPDKAWDFWLDADPDPGPVRFRTFGESPQFHNIALAEASLTAPVCPNAELNFLLSLVFWIFVLASL